MNKKLLISILLILIILGICARFLCLNKEITAEETDFINPAKAILKTGHPIFYQAEQIPDALALWHPPMYIYFLSLIAKFSISETALRSLNFVFSIFTAVIIFLFCLRIDKKRGKQIGLLAAALFLINYYVFSSSILIDIDVLSMFFVFSFFYLVFSYYKTQKISFAILASLSFLFSLANRYPIAIITFFSVGGYFFIKKETRKFTWAYFLIGLIGGIIFLGIWAIYSTLIEPGTFFAFINHNAVLGMGPFSSISLYLSSFALNISQIIRLFTVPALILFISTFLWFIRRKEEHVRILLIYCLSIFLAFIIIPRPAFGYPRYFLTMMPAFFILISLFLYENLIERKIKEKHILLASLIGLIVIFLLLILNPQGTIYRNDGLIRSTNLPDFIFNLACISPIFLILLVRREQRKPVFIACLIIVFLSYNFYFDVKYVMNDSHIRDAGLYLKENTNSSDIVICPKAVGYYYGGKFYMNDYYKPPLNKISTKLIGNYIIEGLDNPSMNSQFFWGDDIYGGIYYSESINLNKEELYNSKYIVVNYLCSDMNPEKIIGNYFVYRMKD
jgi:hypothetical protein